MATAALEDRIIIIAELRGRVDRIDREARALSLRELCQRVAAIGIIARSVGLLPLARLAASLAEALVRDGRGASIRTLMESESHGASSDAAHLARGRP